jgi:hypothetical protein
MYSRSRVYLCLALVCMTMSACSGIGGLQTSMTSGQPKSKLVLVSDFAFAPEIVAIDRGYTARLERKIGAYPAYERRQRTSERVNDEIVATIIVNLREAGLDAQPGGEDTLTLDQTALILSGSLRPSDTVTAKNKNSFGFGAGRGHVVANMTASLFSPGGKRQLLTFSAESSAAKREPGVPPKIAAARNASIASIVVAAGGPSERLSPDVESVARRLGGAVADRVVALAKEQGWLGAGPVGEGIEATPPAAPKSGGDQPAADSHRPGV